MEFALDWLLFELNNHYMVIAGRVENGVVVLAGGSRLPEGASVTISFPPLVTNETSAQKRRIEVPLVRTNQPATVHLTGERIAEILDEDDAPPRR